MYHFSQSNPKGAGQGDVPNLLRAVASTIEKLGEITVNDIVFQTTPTADEDHLRMTVYYQRAPRIKGRDNA
jgi:hypothetical protein